MFPCICRTKELKTKIMQHGSLHLSRRVSRRALKYQWLQPLHCMPSKLFPTASGHPYLPQNHELA